MITVKSAALNGIDAIPIDVEVDIRGGLPNFEIVGLAGQAVKESRERIRSSFKNCNIKFPLQKIIVNLAPANLRKSGTLYDLPISLGILAAMGKFNSDLLKKFIIVGELSLSGEVRSVPGIISIAELANTKKKNLLIPHANINEASYVSSRVFALNNLEAAIDTLANYNSIRPIKQTTYSPQISLLDETIIKGQNVAKRMMQIAAYGHHHALLVGPPGTGKTLLAKLAGSLLPPLSRQAAIETTKVYSAAGLLEPETGLIKSRPIRAPHHNITKTGLLGGGLPIKPGEISLATNGILILDELLEFKTDVLQGLREPLESQQITIVRANERITYPAKFLLIGTTNPCPCGYLGDPYHQCHCSQLAIRRYQKKLIGPLLDRFDLFQFIEPIQASEHHQAGELPQATTHLVNPNGLLTDREVQNLNLNSATRQLLDKALQNLHLSSRGYYKTIKIAQTIAELEGNKEIEPVHVSEALRYRWEAMNIF